jgi:ParB family chromosome partitioning protein
MEDSNILSDPSHKKRKKLALGKGLSALIPGADPLESSDEKEYFLCGIDLIRPNPYQPRRLFTEDDLADLARSIKEQGVIQPLIARKTDDGYEIIAGERRLRAARMAGLTHVPVIVKAVDDENLLEISLVENIQREDLNPVEEADAYHRLMTEFGLTQEDVSERVGKSRSTIANFLRLRGLPQEIRDSLLDGSLSMGHAKALLAAPTPARQIQVWRLILSKGLSVRETERLINRLKEEKSEETEETSPSPEEIYFSDLALSLSRRFGTRVQIKRRGTKGRVEIDFYSDQDLDRLISLLDAGEQEKIQP